MQQFLKTLGILSAKCTVESITEELAKINNIQECMHAMINHFFAIITLVEGHCYFKLNCMTKSIILLLTILASYLALKLQCYE